ncbi:MAG: alanine--tRNA ligase [Planctomycetota bacterium]
MPDAASDQAALTPLDAPGSPIRGADVRRCFIDYFRRAHAHRVVPSSTVVPMNDPSLRDTFANAGMNQFKPVFLGQVPKGSPLEGLTRAVNSQKCIRAGGKHNDLDDVGKDTYHHTFFEMLGNWSFGDFFKAEAIAWAWDFMTGPREQGKMQLDPERLYATYFGGDERAGLEPDTEAQNLWKRHLPADRVLPGDMKDNFWEMGETGPCGPCSELHYDGRDDADRARVSGRSLVNADDPMVIELWNLVFIQYERIAGGKLRALPARHVDTGMGLERLVRVLNGKTSNYDTDLFEPIFEAIHTLCGGEAYRGRVGADDTDGRDEAYRVIADHIRTLCFAIADGAAPSNEGRGYVLRRILRRAVRYGRQKLNAPDGFFARLVPTVVTLMGEAFGELRAQQGKIVEIIADEETSFGKTLEKGIRLFEQAAGEADGKVVPGAEAFKLYDTYGFPLDLTQLMARERGLEVDVAGYEAAMSAQRERAKASGRKGTDDRLAMGPEELDRLAKMKVRPTDDSHKFHAREIRATVRAIWGGKNFDEHADSTTASTRAVSLILDKTSFYAEMGGQVADTGRIQVTRERSTSARDAAHGGEFRVEHVRSFGDYVAHEGRITRGELRVGDDVILHVDGQRRRGISAHHTATHLLNHRLRDAIGDGADQKGSLVAPDRLRFDFAHNGPVDPAKLEAAEAAIRGDIERDLTVHTDLASLRVAQGIAGLRAVFGETYPDPVRVVSIGAPVGTLMGDPDNDDWRAHAIEFCGGTHAQRTGEIGAFALVQEEGIAKGVRRITAVAGVPAQAAIAAADGLEARIDEVQKLADAALRDQVQEIGAQLDELTLPAARRHALRARLDALGERLRQAEKAGAAERAKVAQQQAQQIASSAAASLDGVIVADIGLGEDRKALEAAMGTLTSTCPTAAVMLLSTGAGSKRVAVAAAVPKALVDRGLRAGDWIKHTTGVLGGKGGGRPESAQGSGPDASKLRDAIKAARTFAHQQIG